MIKRSVHDKRIHSGQHGGAPGKDAHMSTVTETMQHEIAQASKRLPIHADQDDTTCCNMMIMNFGGLMSQGFGQHRSIVFLNGKKLEDAKCLLKAAPGVSEARSENCELFLIHGSGQGAGDLPGIWC